MMNPTYNYSKPESTTTPGYISRIKPQKPNTMIYKIVILLLILTILITNTILYLQIDQNPIKCGYVKTQQIWKAYYLNDTQIIEVEEKWNRDEALDAANNMVNR